MQLKSIRIFFVPEQRIDVTTPPVAAGSKYDTYGAGTVWPVRGLIALFIIETNETFCDAFN